MLFVLCWSSWNGNINLKRNGPACIKQSANQCCPYTTKKNKYIKTHFNLNESQNKGTKSKKSEQIVHFV